VVKINIANLSLHWQLNKECYVRYSKEYYKEVEKRVYEMRPDLMKKYYSHNYLNEKSI
jgi:hypothetical protein